MRLPIVPQLSTKDGVSNKNARMTNALKETDASSELVAVRPGMALALRTAGNGKGLVAFNGRLLSVYGSTIGHKTDGPVQDGIIDIEPASLLPSYNIFVSEDGSVLSGNSGYLFGFERVFRFDAWNSVMEDLGYQPTAEQLASGMSSDGSVIVGQSSLGGTITYFRWAKDGGAVDLGVPENIDSIVVSSNGNVIALSGNGRLYRWAVSTGVADLGGLLTGTCVAISADGSVIAGNYVNGSGHERAFRWTVSGGIEDLGAFAGGTSSGVYAVSSDGHTVVGYSSSATFTHASKWTAETGLVDLGTLPGATDSYARAVSADGSVISGFAIVGAQTLGFVWTQATGTVSLGVVSTAVSSTARSISSDGSVIAGWLVFPGNIEHAMYWTAETGMVDIGALWDGAVDEVKVSADGSVIIGVSYNTATGAAHTFRWEVVPIINPIFTSLTGPSFDFAQSVI